MEHNHSNLIYGFIVSYLLFGMGLASSYFAFSGSNIQSKITLLVFGCIAIGISIVSLRKTFKKRDQCEICKDKYRYGKKK